MPLSEQFADRADQAIDGDRLAAFASEMISIKSYSGDERDIATFMADRMRSLGLDVILQEVAPSRYNAIGRWRGQGRAASFMYNGHMDTNPAGEGWTVDPLAGIRANGFVYGIGASNMKAANASFMHSLEALKTTGYQPQGDLIAAFVVGELQGGVGTVKMIESGIRADYFVVGEPTELTILTRHAASFVFEIWVYGKTRHLSKHEEGIDALQKMEKLLDRLRRLKFSGAPNPSSRALNRINVGVIRAGVSQAMYEWRPQQLADTCMVRCAGRFGPGQNLEAAMADLRALLVRMREHDPDFHAELRLVEKDRILMPPFSISPNALPVRVAARAHAEVTGTKAKIGAHTPAKFFGSDAAHLAVAGMKGMLYGPGGKYNTMPDERVAIEEMIAAARVYTRMVTEITGSVR